MTPIGWAALAALVAVIIVLVRQRRQDIQNLEDATRISDLANDALLVADLVDGSIVRANPAAQRLLDYEESELIGRKLPDLHPPELVERSAEVIADVSDKQGLVYSDLPFITKKGERIDVEVS